MRPLPTTFPSYFNAYIKLVPEENVMEALTNNCRTANLFFSKISEEQSLYKYSYDKWTVKEIVQHIIDTERIFTYRTLAICRKEPATLPSFDENKYALNSLANRRAMKDLTEEFNAVRQSTILLYKSLPPGVGDIIGKVSDYQMSVLALGFTIAGHVTHHMNIIKERYWDINVP